MSSLRPHLNPLEWLRRKPNGKASASLTAPSINQPQEHDLSKPSSRPPAPESDIVVSASHVPPTPPAVISVPVSATEYIATPATILPVPDLDVLLPQVLAPIVPALATPVQGLVPTHTVSTIKTPISSALLGPSQRPEDSYGLKVLVEGINPVAE